MRIFGVSETLMNFFLMSLFGIKPMIDHSFLVTLYS